MIMKSDMHLWVRLIKTYDMIPYDFRILAITFLFYELRYLEMDVNGSQILSAKEIFKEIQSVCDDFCLNSLKKTLQSVKNFADQNQYLDIAILGQFKAGKSSFLNGFVNKDLLPVGIIPVTSVITRMKYGVEEKAIVTFMDGVCKEIPIKEIKDYVSETGNPENRKKVYIVDIETPLLSKIKEIRLVDTPGIGSVWKHNTETTTDWFPETGGVLFIISAEKPISENELSLLKEIYLYSHEIAIVITKTDLFKEEQIKEIESFSAEVIKKAFNKNFPIIRYSAYVNTNEYNKMIEQNIFMPLARNRDKTYTELLQYKLISLVNSCLSYMNISYQASLKKESEKAQLKNNILDEHLNFHFIRQELLLIVGSYKEKTRENFEDYLDSFKKDIEDKIINEYETLFTNWKGNLFKVTRQYENWLNHSLELELKEILLKEEKSFELLNAVKKHLSFYLKSFRERLNDNLDRVLDVKMKPEEWKISLGELEKPDISISRSFDFHLDMLWFLFPMFLYRRVFRHYFLGQIPYEIKKNLYRLVSDLNGKVNKEMDSFTAQALSYMNEELKTVEMLISESKRDSNHVLIQMDHLSDFIKGYTKIN
jgi:GTP-binding protein EngB required for normal cell division